MPIIGACNCSFTSKWAYSWGREGGLNVGELISSSLRYTTRVHQLRFLLSCKFCFVLLCFYTITIFFCGSLFDFN